MVFLRVSLRATLFHCVRSSMNRVCTNPKTRGLHRIINPMYFSLEAECPETRTTWASVPLTKSVSSWCPPVYITDADSCIYRRFTKLSEPLKPFYSNFLLVTKFLQEGFWEFLRSGNKAFKGYLEVIKHRMKRDIDSRGQELIVWGNVDHSLLHYLQLEYRTM